MTRIVWTIILALTFSMFFQVLPVTGKEEQKQKEWTGKLKDGKILTKNDLKNILSNHKKWLETDKTEGKRADLSEAYLFGAVLNGADLYGAKISGADLGEAELRGVNLRGADLSGSDLDEADLFEADLYQADLSEAYLYGAYMYGAILGGTDLYEADLSKADLRKVNLKEADLYGTKLYKADLREADLRKADLYEADLSEADLYGADLSEAYLFGAILYKVDLRETYLRDTDFREADLYGVKLEFKPGSMPNFLAISTAYNLSELKYSKSPHSLVELREIFKKEGLHRQRREITCAIKSAQRYNLWYDPESSLWNKLEGLFYLMFFELPSSYGMKPGRPLIILICLIPFFSLFYVFALKTKSQKTGIWLIFLKERVIKATKKERPFKLTAKFPPRTSQTGNLNSIKLIAFRSFRIIRIALYFSLLSATSIGWREFNIGSWITRIQRREYTLRATGWVRTVSGLQSLVSVYLLALWALTYFGQPFESI